MQGVVLDPHLVRVVLRVDGDRVGAHRPAQHHPGSHARIGIAEVTIDGDVLRGGHEAAQTRIDVVARAQRDAQFVGEDERAFHEDDVLVGGEGVGHGQPHRAASRQGALDVERTVGLDDEDAARSGGRQPARPHGGGIDIEIVVGHPDGATVGVQELVDADDVRRRVVEEIEDAAVQCGERHVVRCGTYPVDVERAEFDQDDIGKRIGLDHAGGRRR